MIDKIVGDSIIFEANLVDGTSVAISDAVANITVVDFAGSTVLASTAPYTSAGTYQKTVSTTGWNRGPIVEQWKFTNSGGTTSRSVTNGFRIIGTDTINTYAAVNELRAYYENIEDYFTGDEEALVVDAFNEVNAKLESLGQKMPIKAKADGFYDQPLRDLNAYEAIMRIVGRRQSGYNRESDTPWFTYFGSMAKAIYKDIGNKVYNFDREYSVSEGGIGIATKVAGSRTGTMETNWRGNVGNGFTDAGFERDWQVIMTGTGTLGEVNEGTYKWSKDGGLSFNTGYISSYDWKQLDYGVHVRFTRGTASGTTNVFASNDQWNFKTFPVNQTVGGKRTARSY